MKKIVCLILMDSYVRDCQSARQRKMEKVSERGSTCSKSIATAHRRDRYEVGDYYFLYSLSALIISGLVMIFQTM